MGHPFHGHLHCVSCTHQDLLPEYHCLMSWNIICCWTHALNQQVVAPRRCYQNKTTKPIVNSLYFNERKGINVVLLLTGDACDAFQHFAAWIPARYAMMHEWIMRLANGSQSHPSIKYFNITIASNAKWDRPDSIQTWFWKAMGYGPGINIINEFVNVTIEDIEGWCARDKHAFYAPLVIAPFVSHAHPNDPHLMFTTNAPTLTPMYSWNIMHSIKKYVSHVGRKRDLIIYLDRAEARERMVENNHEVVAYLSKFVAKHQSFNLLIKQGKTGTFDEEKELFSRALIIIGPHGGLFANMIFMQYASYVVEFNGWISDSHRPFYYALAQSNGLHYYYLAPNDFEYNGKMTIDIGNLEIILNKILIMQI
eukprot:6563_1